MLLAYLAVGLLPGIGFLVLHAATQRCAPRQWKGPEYGNFRIRWACLFRTFFLKPAVRPRGAEFSAATRLPKFCRGTPLPVWRYFPDITAGLFGFL